MASNCRQWTLLCYKCKSHLASNEILMIGIVPPSQHHLAVRRDCELRAEQTLRKEDVLEVDSKRSLFRLLCQNCNSKVGSVEQIEGNEVMCLKAEAVSVWNIFGGETHEKKLKKLIPELEKFGIDKVKLSRLAVALYDNKWSREAPTPLVYCDTSHLRRDEINSFTFQTPRDYQCELFTYAMQGNSLVFLPTGSGKTLIAAMAISCMKKLNPRKLAVFIVDRIPLAHQQADYIKEHTKGLAVSVLAGDRNENEMVRTRIMNNLVEKKTDVLVLTHQIFLNILSDEEGVVKLSDICILVIDEAHRCQGNHPYHQIMRDHYVKLIIDKFKPLILALTASPAGEACQVKTIESLQGLLSRLCCSARMPTTSQDLVMYTHKPKTTYKMILMTSYQQALDEMIENFLKVIVRRLAIYGKCSDILKLSPRSPSYRGCLRQITGQCHDEENHDGYALSELVMHLIGILEINNVLGLRLAIECLEECFELIENESSPNERRKKTILQSEPTFHRLKEQVKSLKFRSSTCETNEKFSYLVGELKRFSRQADQDSTSRGIVFVQMRKTAFKFCDLLLSYPEICSKLNPKPFVGHGEGGTDGMEWQDEQKITLKQFRSGRTKLLISTSVLEEGLDVPICNMVIRFDSLPSLRAHVQSRGRASRRANSKFILIFSDEKGYTDAQMVVVKERNMEDAMRLLHNTSQGMVNQARKFSCEVQKPMLLEQPISPNPANRVLQQRYEIVATNTVSVLVVLPSEDDMLQNSLAIRFFRQNHEIKEMNIEAVNEADNTPAALKFKLECGEHEISEFQEQLTQSWCDQQNEAQSWLELDDTRRRRTAEVNVLSGELFFVGYFLRRNHYCRQWPTPQPMMDLHCIRLVFQHDLKSLLILFTVIEPLSTSLYEIEINYSLLENFILVDRQQGYSNLFLFLKHPPKLYKTSRDVQVEWDAEVLVADDDDSGFFEDVSSEEEVDQESDEERVVGDDDGYDNRVQNDDNVIHTGENENVFSHPILSTLDRITHWSRVPCIADSGNSFGKCLSYMVTVPDVAFSELLTSLRNTDKKVYFSGVTDDFRPLQDPSDLPLHPGLDQEVTYALHCLLCNYPSLVGRISDNFSRLLSETSKNAALAGLEELTNKATQDIFCQPDETLGKILQSPNLRPKRFMARHTPSHCALVKRLIVTPTRLLFGPEEIIQNNRVLRNFNPSNFMCVNIRDEDFSRISGSSADLTDVLVYLKSIIDGGIEVCGDQYLFLGCSNSQLRNHSFWLVKACAKPDEIRTWMGDFSSIRCIGTYVSRMGQCFSTSLDAVGITVEQGVIWSPEDDVKTADKKYCFSDGIGRISPQLANQVTKMIGKKFKPSAFQIRFAGCKGVLAIDDSLTGKKAFFRKSMTKFESPHRRLEVLATSRPQAVYLNHQLIMLLSNLGVPDVVFVKLMREALDNLAGMLLDERKAVHQLCSTVKTGIAYNTLSEVGVALTVEPFFRCVIASVYHDHLHSLLTRSRIKLDPRKARLMIGVMDETGVLQYGQVFVQYSECNSDPKSYEDFNLDKRCVLRGPVMVTRNPCLHPGDMRRLVAVDAPELHHLVDCVVFPSVGPRPHPNEMAGGDLDGDLYFVTWHQDLLSDPDKDLFPPMNYDPPPKQEKPDDITTEDMTKFLIDYIRSDQLGIIDNAHKAHADIEPDGIESEKCLLLAKAHSLAVDAPKTGCWPSLGPSDMKVKKYPDFMMKSDKPSYKSSKVLGKLFRACRALKRNTDQNPSVQVKRPVIDRAFVVPGYEVFLSQARSMYLKYCGNIEQIMSTYGIASEAELISGCFRKLYKRLSRERNEVAEIVIRLVEDIRVEFRTKFFKEFHLDASRHKQKELIDKRIHQKACAWYHVAYAEEPGTHGKRFLSFPWVVDDVMASIKEVKRKLARKESWENLSDMITYPKLNDVTQRLMEYIVDEKDTLLTDYKRRLSGRYQVANQIHNFNRNLRVVAFGSTATFLFKEDSDVDLCVFHNVPKQKTTKKEQLKLLNPLKAVLCKLFTNVRLVDRAKVPVILCKKFKSSEVPGSSIDVPFDLSASTDGLDKALMITGYIMSYPTLLPLLRFLVTWAKVSGLTGHGKLMIVNSNCLVFMFLAHCVANRFVSEPSDDVVQHFRPENSKDFFLREWENVLSRLVDPTTTTPNLGCRSLGEVLISFFASHFSIAEKVLPTSIGRLLKANTVQELLNQYSITLLQEHLQRAYHVIALYGDLDCLLRLSAAEIRHVVHLSTGLSNAMKGAEHENARELKERTGAQVCIRSKGSSLTHRLIVEAKGTELQVEAVEHILQDMTRTTSALKAAFMSMCFVKGASQMLFEGSSSNNDVVTFNPYHSSHHPQHDGTRLYTPVLSVPTRVDQQSSNHVYNSFKQKFITQFALVKRDHEESLHGFLEFVVHFGRIYIFRVPKSFIEDPEAVTIKMLQANLNRDCKAARTRPDVPRRDVVVTHSGSTRRKKKRSRKKKAKQEQPQNDKKNKKPKEKPCRSSYFTRIKSVQAANAFLERRGFVEVASYECYNVHVKSDGDDFSLKFDDTLCFQELNFTPLRWSLTDVKRRWIKNPTGAKEDGAETDIRFLLQSRRFLNRNEIVGTEYEVYVDIMKATAPSVNTTKKQKRPFEIKEELWKQVFMVRHKKTRRFRDLSPSSDSSLFIDISEVTEYSRPKAECSCFRKVFTRHELNLELQPPQLSADVQTISQFLWKVWKLAFSVSDFVSA